VGLFPKDRDLTRPPTEVELRVDAHALRLPDGAQEVRLDRFLAHHLHWRSRTSIQELVRSEHVLVDPATPDHPRGSGALAVERRPGRRLRHGSRVVVVIPEGLRLPQGPTSADELVVLWEDESALAVDKPAFVVVHPSHRHPTDTLIQRVHARYGVGREGREGAPRLCHRLDRETSGIVLVGKDPRSHSALRKQFERKQVEKEYLALVLGAPEGEEGVIEFPIARARASRVGLKMAVLADGLPSRTEWRVVERRPHCTLVAARPITGRQHQIRVHMEAIGHPLVGDKLYGGDDRLFEKGLQGALERLDWEALGMTRHALHNHKLAFVSPASRARVEVASPLPADMRAYLEGAAVPSEGRGPSS
jgi:23S rRNA pseudouridine1911/1915/1917 synthase